MCSDSELDLKEATKIHIVPVLLLQGNDVVEPPQKMSHLVVAMASGILNLILPMSNALR